jgi:hypothetical protein
MNSKTNQDKHETTKQDKKAQAKTIQTKTREDRQNKTKETQDKTRQQNKAKQGNANQRKARQGEAKEIKVIQIKAMQGKAKGVLHDCVDASLQPPHHCLLSRKGRGMYCSEWLGGTPR